jgi:hypothetical protein
MKLPEAYRHLALVGLKVLAVVLLLEVTIFNLPAYRLRFGSDSSYTLSLDEAEVSGEGQWTMDEEGALCVTGSEEVQIAFSDIGRTMETLTLEVEFEETAYEVELTGDVSDETHAAYRESLLQQTLYNYEPDSCRVLCALNGAVKSLRLHLSCEQEDGAYRITGIRVNEPVPFDFSFVRVFMLWFLPMLAYALLKCSTFLKSFRDAEGSFLFLSDVSYMAAVFIACVMIFCKVDTDQGLRGVFLKTSGDQMTQELVDAFEAGQVSLLEEPSEELLELSNPYDIGLRDETDVDALWDHVLYNGRYYSYYGIAPVVLLFLPFHLLTGYYCSTELAVFLFAIVGMFFLRSLYIAVVRKWFSGLPIGLILGGELVLLCTCGIWYPLSRPKFYEAAVAAGFMFLTMGVYFLLTSNICKDGRISLKRLAAASTALALGVLSRPTVAVYCICGCLFMAAGFRKWRTDHQGHPWTYWLCALLPMGLLGAVQMAYNWVRFGSVLEFGIQYSLTINDFTRVQFHLIYVLILLYNYLLAPVRFTAAYPFIGASFSRLDVNGYLFKDNGNTPGLLFLALPMVFYLFAGRAIKQLPKKQRGWTVTLVGSFCVVMPLVIIAAAWNSGYAVRYLADFSWEMVFGARLIFFYLYRNCADETKKRFLQCFMTASAVWAIAVNAVLVYNICFLETTYPYMAYELERIFAFWK